MKEEWYFQNKNFSWRDAEAYLETCQTAVMELFAQIANGF